MSSKNEFDFTNIPGKSQILKNIKGEYEVKPLISIITPYYNADKYIFETANSIFNQTFPFWEWIIVNDGSTKENTKEVLDELQKKDSRIRILNKENAGPAAARYFGVENAQADIVFTLDADDLIINTMLECGYFSLLTNKEAIWAYTPIVTFGDNNYLYNPIFETFTEKKENLISVASFIRKDKFLELKTYKTLPKDVHEDWYMWLSFLSRGYFPIKMNFYGFWYRRMSTGRLGTINSNKSKTKIAESYLKKVKKNIKRRVGAIQFPISDEYEYNTYPEELEFYNFDFMNLDDSDSKKRILFIFPWCVIGGADKFNLDLIRHLKENGYKITVITTEPSEDLYSYEFRKDVDEFFDLSTFLAKKEWAGFISYIIRSRKIQLVFFSNSFYGYYCIPWLKCKYPKIPFVDYLHAEDWSWRDGSYPRDSIAVSRFLDKTYTCTNYLKEIMHGKMGKKVNNTEVVYIGADTDRFNTDINFEDEDEYREKFKGKKVILFPCRIVYLKRPLLVVDIIKKITSKNKDIVCLVVGDGEAKKEMQAKVKKEGLIEYFCFVPMREDIRVFYKIADLTLICSLTEGLTLTAYESMAFGVPVVTADVGGQKELVDNNCGKVIKKYQSVEKDLLNFYYSKEEINEYANAIEKIIYSDDYEEISKKCKYKILNGFSSNNMKDNMLEKLDSLIKSTSMVNENICKNEELASRYLVLFNECKKNIYFNPDIRNSKVPTKFRDFLWKFKIWQRIIKVIKRDR